MGRRISSRRRSALGTPCGRPSPAPWVCEGCWRRTPPRGAGVRPWLRLPSPMPRITRTYQLGVMRPNAWLPSHAARADQTQGRVGVDPGRLWLPPIAFHAPAFVAARAAGLGIGPPSRRGRSRSVETDPTRSPSRSTFASHARTAGDASRTGCESRSLEAADRSDMAYLPPQRKEPCRA